jgi:uncharacterized membrane protein
MNEPWFDPAYWAWLPGTAFGLLAGCWGGLAGWLAPQGRGRKLVLGAGWALFGAALLLLFGSLRGYLAAQPYGVWYGLGLPGLLGVILLPSLLPLVYRRYHESELRRMQAENL